MGSPKTDLSKLCLTGTASLAEELDSECTRPSPAPSRDIISHTVTPLRPTTPQRKCSSSCATDGRSLEFCDHSTSSRTSYSKRPSSASSSTSGTPMCRWGFM
jgi:hypothetical protein